MFIIGWSPFWVILFVYNIGFVFLITLFEKRNPASIWAWLLVLFVLPYIGSFIYLILGFEARKHRIFMKKAHDDTENISKIRAMHIEGLDYQYRQDELFGRGNVLKNERYSHLDDLLYLNYYSGTGALTLNNNVDFYFNGNDKFDRLFEDIENAEKFIHLEYYIFRNDNLGKKMISALAKKAAEGVEVCLLVDGMGTSFARRPFFSDMLDVGGHLAVFIPPRFIRLNYRNHRKLAIIDGKWGYIGGLNIGDEYLGQKKRFGHWRDAHIRISGDAVKELEQRFMLDWNNLSEYKLKADPVYFPVCEAEKGMAVQIVSSGPDTKWPSVYQSVVKMMAEADKSIYIQTPYFIPDDAILETLKIAALSGIDVRIVIPKHPDHLFVYWASTSYLGDLLPCGVKCYEYERGFLHSKLVIVDDKIVSVGTANMDERSFKLNFEVNAFIYDEGAAKTALEQFMRDIEDCTEFTEEDARRRSKLDKLKEAFARLISPLL